VSEKVFIRHNCIIVGYTIGSSVMPKRISEIFGVSEDDLKKEGVLHGFINLDSVFYVYPPPSGKYKDFRT
jgi:hypothetical protein